MKILFIHQRKGLYQLTKCGKCGHTFDCANCDAKLITYRQSYNTLELLCHQCQSYYKYPLACPKCSSNQVYSRFGGVEELVEILEQETLEEIVRYDLGKQKISKKQLHTTKLVSEDQTGVGYYSDEQLEIRLRVNIVFRQENKNLVSSHLLSNLKGHEIAVSTRIFDPAIEYDIFDKIIFVQAENLLSSPDYLVQEETMKSLAEVFIAIKDTGVVYFDTNSPEIEFFQELLELNTTEFKVEDIQKWYFKFINKEDKIREKFGFPPYRNLLLLTTQEKTKERSLEILKAVKTYLDKSKTDLEDCSWTDPYPARFLKRKNMFSHHILLRYPRQYTEFSRLKAIIYGLSQTYNLQVRLNPRHLF